MSLSGCRVNESDVERWGSTAHGPDKLVAVLTHSKYDPSLRVAAGLELVKMKPRNGRRVGITMLVDALSTLSPDERKPLVAGMAPSLISEIKKAPPPTVPNQPPPVDTSYPYKDAVVALLTYDRAVLVSDDAQRKALTDALIDWSQHDFEHRLDNSTQMFGIEQMMRAIGAPAVRGLPSLITADSTKIDRIASLVSELGDDATKTAAAMKLVEVAQYTSSQAWVDKTRPSIEEANRASGQKDVSAARLAIQIAQYQDETLTRIFAALKKVGTRPAVDYCLSFAADKTQPEKRRQAALAALEGRIDKNNPKDIERVLELATSDDTPDGVRDLAFQRVGEMPREQVIGKLYALFNRGKWKVRWVAAGTALKMLTTAELPEFMSKLPGGSAAGFAITEPLSYGAAIDKMTVKDNKSPRQVMTPYLHEGTLAQKLTALGYFYAAGKQSDLSLIASLEQDRAPVPKIDDPEAKWQCDVPKADGKETETKEIKTVGEFVKDCVEPAMKGRT